MELRNRRNHQDVGRASCGRGNVSADSLHTPQGSTGVRSDPLRAAEPHRHPGPDRTVSDTGHLCTRAGREGDEAHQRGGPRALLACSETRCAFGCPQSQGRSGKEPWQAEAAPGTGGRVTPNKTRCHVPNRPPSSTTSHGKSNPWHGTDVREQRGCVSRTKGGVELDLMRGDPPPSDRVAITLSEVGMASTYLWAMCGLD